MNTDKLPVKAMVIACNTATAYGKEYIEEFLQKANADIKVIGVIDAGVRGTLQSIKKDEMPSLEYSLQQELLHHKGYRNTILKMKDELGIQVI